MSPKPPVLENFSQLLPILADLWPSGIEKLEKREKKLSKSLSLPMVERVLLLGVVLPHLPVGKTFLRFCLVKLTKID